jgi:hypothetical protein
MDIKTLDAAAAVRASACAYGPRFPSGAARAASGLTGMAQRALVESSLSTHRNRASFLREKTSTADKTPGNPQLRRTPCLTQAIAVSP